MEKKSNFLYYFSTAVVGLYFVLGLFMMFSPSVAAMLPEGKNTILGIIVMLYGVFRVYRLRKLNESLKNEHNS
jgi:uncharacterized membrane protein